MKIFIVVDMEGATGVVHPDQLAQDARGYGEAQKFLTADINAAINGALLADPTATFRVADGHGPMRNVLLSELHSAAELVVGGANAFNKPLCQVEGIDESFDLAFMIGFHSMAGTPSGLLAHTFVGSLVKNLRLNSRTVGEAEMDAAILADFGVPVGLVVGNSDLESEIREWNAHCEFVATKQTLGPTAAVCSTPPVTAQNIISAAQKSVQAFKTTPPRISAAVNPVVIEVDTYRREQAARLSRSNNIELISDSTIRVSAPTATEAFRDLWVGIAQTLENTPEWLT